ncbi:MAG: 3-isopropylmalate dehydratase large subunit, partial [Betaproteobacteria bacterium]|nr:3-isopropylmalate dehydratase large subunit [Betaproteobacteria bacterium]
MNAPRTMFEKIWDRHVIVRRGGNEALLHVDRNFVHEGSFHAFGALAAEGRKVRKPRQTFATADHYVPTRNREQGINAVTDPEMRNMLELFAQNTRANGIANYYGLDHPQQGIVHVVGPELGITQPGLVITCGDSHTSTHGAFGALAVGIGASQLKQILATQCIWQKQPKTMRITVAGAIPSGVTAKDIVLAIIAKIGTAGATGHAIEYAGSAIRALSMEGRLTVCNMSIEAGARAGMIAPDDKTCAWLEGREFSPTGAHWEKALAFWRSLPTDDGARFDREVMLDATTLAPMVTWGTSPEEAASITTAVPDPASAGDADKRAHMAQALRYMELKPGTPLEGIKIQRAFI